MPGVVDEATEELAGIVGEVTEPVTLLVRLRLVARAIAALELAPPLALFVGRVTRAAQPAARHAGVRIVLAAALIRRPWLVHARGFGPLSAHQPDKAYSEHHCRQRIGRDGLTEIRS